MEICECGHDHALNMGGFIRVIHTLECRVCGCVEYSARHDPRYDPDDVADQGYSDEGFPYSGLGKVRR